MDSDFWCWLRREADCLGVLIVLLFFLYLNRGAGLANVGLFWYPYGIEYMTSFKLRDEDCKGYAEDLKVYVPNSLNY